MSIERERSSDRDGDAGLAAALRALPLDAPDRDCWPKVQAALAASRRRLGLVFAWAALVALTLGLPRWLTPPVPPPSAVLSAEIREMQRASQALEHWLAQVDALHVADSATALLLAADIEDRIAIVDAALADAPETEVLQHALWSERVLLLGRLANLRNSSVLAGDGVRPALFD